MSSRPFVQVTQSLANAVLGQKRKAKKGKEKMTSQEAKPTGHENFEAIWNRVRERLKIELGAQRYQYWVAPFVSFRPKAVASSSRAPSRFERDKVVESHGERIANMIPRAGRRRSAHVDFVVETRPRVVVQNAAASARATTIDSLAAPLVEPVLVQGSIPLNADYTFDNYVTGKSNQIAFQEAKRTADAEQPVTNPLFLFGATGLGKTHLMHAIAWRKLQRNPNLRVLLITAETFMRLFVTALKANDTVSFKNQMRNVDLLARRRSCISFWARRRRRKNCSPHSIGLPTTKSRSLFPPTVRRRCSRTFRIVHGRVF